MTAITQCIHKKIGACEKCTAWQIVQVLKKYVKKDFGKKCKNFHWGCPACNARQSVETLEDLYEV